VAEFRRGVALALDYAHVLGVPQLNALAGVPPAGVSQQQAWDTLVDNLRFAAAALAARGLRLLLEPINTEDVPGFFINRTAQALAVLDAVGADNAFVQYDVYHAQRMEGDLAATLQRHLTRIGHVQIADNPGRHEPGTGEIDFGFLLAHLDRIGYTGWVGCEYLPAGSTQMGLGWWAAQTGSARAAPPPSVLLRQMFDAAVASVQPAVCVPPHVPKPSEVPGRLVVIGAGKASAAMAQAVEAHWAGDPARLSGLVVTRYGYEAPCQRIEIASAAHPVPDAAGQRAAQRLLELVAGLGPQDTVLCLISGGGSALLPLPPPGLSLADKQGINRALLASGATIAEMNGVRRHLSAIKGGRLAAACSAGRMLTLLLSDVPGDDPVEIASGPTVADPSTCADALAIVARLRIALPPAAQHLLESGLGESIKPGDARLACCQTRLIATPRQALQAAAQVARAAGVTPYILGDAIEGEAREVGKVLAALAHECATWGAPFALPCVLLSGGETTVTVRGDGQGGRNVEGLLSAAIALREAPGVYALMADTDGVDGALDVAGAVVTPSTLARAWALGINPLQSLDRNDAHSFFGALGDAVITGPTRTNVNDFRVFYISRP
jgi:hydroxypyruvate reductase